MTNALKRPHRKTYPLFVCLFALVLILSCSFANRAHAATGDITAVRIAGDATHNGWTAEIDITGLNTGGVYAMGLGANNDPANSKVVFTVTSPGYDASGNATTLTRTVYGTKFVRKPYPNDAQADEVSSGGTLTVKVALSDFIYSGDTGITATIGAGFYASSTSNNAVTGISVTNNSVLAYPKAIGRWAWPGYERVTGDFLVEAVAFNRFARNGKPLAAMKFTATDQHGNSVTQTTANMTKTTRSGDANIVQVYAATIPVSTLTQGDLIEVNFQAYPWVGNSGAILNSATTSDGVAQPDERLGPLYEINDKSGTYGAVFAVVDDTNGLDTNATTYVQTSQATAESNYNSSSTQSYRSIGRATAAIKAYNNANYSRNEPGGGTILLNSGNHAYPGTAPAASGAMNTWLIIKPMSTVTRAQAVINGGGNFGALSTERLKLSGITITKAGTGAFNGRVATDVLWLDALDINTGAGVASFYVWKLEYATQNTITSFVDGFKSFGPGVNKDPYGLIRGNTFPTGSVGADVYAVIGNNNIIPDRWLETGNSQTQAISDNSIVAFNSIFNVTNGPVYNMGSTNIATGTAIVQNIFELKATTNPMLNIQSSTNQVNTSNNVLMWNNDFVGSRQNLAYNAFGSTAYLQTNWSAVGNQWDDWNIKSDNNASFDTANGGRTGDWSVLYNIGSRENFYRTAGFPPEFYGVSSKSSGTPGYTSDNSSRGSVSGNGTYTLVATSSSIDLATTTSALEQVLPFDFLGNSIYGSPDAGAYEYQPPYVMGTDQVSTSTVVRTYGDEKFRNKGTPSAAGTADLTIQIPGNDTTNWLDASVSTWSNSGTRHKVWTETSNTLGLNNTVHIVGDLAANTPYTISVDGVAGANISGAGCVSGTCTSNGSGRVTFTYSGGYSSHTFDVNQGSDVSPPIISSIASSTTQTTAAISFVTDEAATSTINYGLTTSYGTASSSLSLATTTSFSLTGLTAGTLYHFRISASDASGNLATSSDLTFTTTAPVSSAPTVTVEAVSSLATSSATLNGTVTADGNASSTVRGFNYGLNTSYGSTASTTGSFGTGAFSQGVSGLTPSTLYHVQAFATNSGGTGTSSDVTFTTSAPPDTTPPVISSIATSSTVSTATISWSTNENATSTVRYGTTTGYGSASSSAALSTSPSITVSGLAAATTYHFQINSWDAASNLATSSDVVIITTAAPDTTAPVISSVASSTTTSTATVTWTTNENASSTVEYGLTTGYGSASSSVTLETSHSLILSGLSEGTQYHFRVSSTDASGNRATSSDYILTTSVTPDTTGPVISSISASPLITSATITWTTNENATSTVNYGLTTGYGSASSSVAAATSHSIGLSGLTGSTLYHYQIKVWDASGNLTTASDATFTTSAVPDTTAPVISSIASSTAENTATVTWTTNEAASSTIEYGLTSSYGNTTADATLLTSHSIDLSGLALNTTYHFRVSSTDASGNRATSSDYLFTTPATPVIPEEPTDEPPRRSGGRSGGGGGSSSSGNTAPAPTASLSTPTAFFTRNLTVNDSGPDVTALQLFLISKDFAIPAGATGLFGPQTKAALIQYQTANGISPASGYFGPLTQASLASGVQVAVPTAPVTATSATFTRDLTIGDEGEDARALQVYLNTHGFPIAATGPGSFGNESPYFGVLTKNALARFQSAKGIVPSVGNFGPITRQYISLH